MNQTEVLLTNRHLHDLNPIVMGSEQCESGHRFGPAVRSYTLLHYVVSGKGYFQAGGMTYEVSAGDLFRILPGEVTVYWADQECPWYYRWVGFDGALSARFAALPPVLTLSAGAARFFALEDSDGSPEYRVAAKLFRLYDELFGETPKKGNYVRQVQDYVDASYMTDLRVENIAAQLHLNRRYLSRLFRQKTGQTIQNYILSVRMAEAVRCLSEGLSVGESAERCGYADVFLFSKMFKRQFGISPAHWKKEHCNIARA